MPCSLSKHTPHDSNRSVYSYVLDAQGERLNDEGGVKVEANSMANSFGSDPEFCPLKTVPVFDEVSTFTVEPCVCVCHATLWFWFFLLAVSIKRIP